MTVDKPDTTSFSPSDPDPANEELRRKALLALLNYASHELGPMGFCIDEAIEELQDHIGQPLTAEQALDLYSTLLNEGVEPQWETWCTEERGAFEDSAIAEQRLRIQQEILATASSGEQAIITIDEMDPNLVVGFIVTEGDNEKNIFCEAHFGDGGSASLRHREVLAPEAIAYGLLCGVCDQLLVALAKPGKKTATEERTNQQK